MSGRYTFVEQCVYCGEPVELALYSESNAWLDKNGQTKCRRTYDGEIHWHSPFENEVL